MGNLPNSLKGWSQPHDERNWLDGTVGTCPGETLVGKSVRITQGKHAGKRGTVVRHLPLWMGAREDRYAPQNGHGFEVRLDDGPTVRVPWFPLTAD